MNKFISVDDIQFERSARAPIYQSQPLKVASFQDARPLSLWLPQAYFERSEPFPLALFFDGQNLFEDEGTLGGGWHLHRVLARREEQGLPVPVVLGLHHGQARDEELSPFPTLPGTRGQGAELMQWVHERLFPRLKSALRLDLTPLKTLVGGSSLGGLLALYSLFHYPRHYGKALAMSPALWPDRFAILQDLMMAKPLSGAQLYLDHGKKEVGPEHKELGDIMFQQSELLANLMECLGLEAGRTLMWHPDPEGEHNEKSWSRRLPQALEFLYD